MPIIATSLRTLLPHDEVPPHRQYQLVETFLLKLLGKEAESQGKKLHEHVRVTAGERGRPFEVDAVAPNGLDDLVGPTLIDIKLTAPRVRSRFDEILSRCDSAAMAGGCQSALIVFGAPLTEGAKRWAAESGSLRSGIPLKIWDGTDVDSLVAKHLEFAKQLGASVEAVHLDSIVQASASDSEAWVERRRQYVADIREAYVENDLTLFLGAGASISAGVPSWEGLLNGLLANLVRRNQPDAITEQELQEIIAGLRLIDTSSPLVSARYLRRGLGDSFLSEVAALLYQSIERSSAAGGTQTMPTLSALAKLCIPRRSGPGVKSVVTYNFDDLFEEQLRIASVPHRSISSEGTFEGREELAVYHVHGYLPRNHTSTNDAPVPPEGLVFSEEGYHHLFSDPYSWTNLVQLSQLRDATCLMIGLSLSDPNLRRLLEVSARKNEKYFHYAIMKRLSTEGFLKASAKVAGPKAREEAVEKFLSLHHRLQEELAEELGIRIVWVNTHGEIPEILQTIGSV